jgi:para-nitrobenzyl esterase
MKRFLVLVLALGLLSATLVTSAHKASAAPNSLLDPGLVQTNKGWIQGLVNPLTGEREYLGIPYAAPPVGNLRWKAPQLAASWGGVRWTTSYGNACLQPGILNIAGSTILGVNNVFNESIGSEDCLYLNVYTPSILVGSNLPVMVWIPGGAFEFGAGSYDPSALVEQSNEIVVTLNYRLGAFGFLALPGLSAEASNGSTGNYGLQDQQAALRWVQANIANFGGNAHNVTIFGESAGGGSACDQIASPLAAGLFQKAITESGPCEGESDFGANPLATNEQNGTTFAASVGCTGSVSAVVACMRSVSASSLVVFSSFSASDLKEGTNTLPFAPTIDGSVLPTSVAAALRAGTYNHVPVLEGTNLNEAALFVFAQFLASGALSSAQYSAALQQIFG